MKHYYTRNKRIFICILCIVLAVYAGNVLCAAFNRTPLHAAQQPVYSDYAGSSSCTSCHRSICESVLHTAHYLTSKPAARQYIRGSFAEGENHFIYNNMLQVILDSSNGAYWQTATANGTEYESQPFDIVIGSGRKGQTYLYWNNGSLYELPVSYYTPLNSWCNSPGFPANFINFNRQIPARCIECHGTYANNSTDAARNTLFDSTQLIYGIDCERCHGPAAKHVAYQQAHPADSSAHFIITIKELSREQKLDACALCHSGARQAIQPAFSFQTGDKLADYSLPNYNSDSVSMLDVHGNQFGLLTSSKCFKMSQMDCSSCHNVHMNEAKQLQIFSARCAICHTSVKHTSFSIPANAKLAVANNCIDCHMPLLPSKKIVLQLSGRQQMTPDLVRTHRIAIYPEQTGEFLKKLQ